MDTTCNNNNKLGKYFCNVDDFHKETVDIYYVVTKKTCKT